MVTVAQLKDFCKDLVDVHGQYDHQSLLDPENHLRLIDAFGKKTIQPLKNSVAASYEKYSEAKRSLDSLLAAERPLPEKYRDHPLENSRNYKRMRECHIKPDWLLIYKTYADRLVLELIRTGTHSDLF